MATDVILPELGENIETGVISKILVQKGDQVEVDQPLVEIETDKAVIEVPSTVAGVVADIFVAAGDEVRIGQKIVAVDGNAVSDAQEKPAQDVEEKTEDKSIQSEQAPEEPPKVETPEPDDDHESAKEPVAVIESTGVAPAAPSVRRFAREIGVDINQVPGSGPGARISMDDVKHFAKANRSQSGAASGRIVPVGQDPLPDFAQWGDIEKEPMSMIRKKTAAHLGNVWNTTPQVTQFDQADMTDLENFRKKYGPKVEQAGGKLTVTAILMKIIAGALKVFPQFNASIDVANEEIIYKKYYHIGLAVDTQRGLLVPVLRDVDQMNLTDISAALSQIAEKARNGKLSLEEMRGGNFTISNLGGIGGTAFTPIVNAPEVGILGVSRSFWQPTYVSEGQLEPRLILPLSLTYDHRIIDGALGARFLRWVVEAIEQPLLLTLEG